MTARDSNLWERFLAHSAQARAKPTFDAEERGWRFLVADKLQEAFRTARDGGDSLELLKGVYVEGKLSYLIYPRHWEWLQDWVATGRESLARALAPFLVPDMAAEERFDSFARAAEEAQVEGMFTVDQNAVLALGSLFNFAVEPESSPMWVDRFGPVSKLLGSEPQSGEAPAVALYAVRLAFARQLRTRMEQSGIPVRDMVDVQSLICIAASERNYWARDPAYVIGRPPVPPEQGYAKREAAEAKSYLSICAMYRDEAPYLAEWIEFHRLVGVDHFFLYNNRSTDAHREVLAPYLQDGIVTVYEWEAFPPSQKDIYDQCLSRHRADSRWIAFIDIDEFLFSPTGQPLPDILPEYEQWPGVGVNWAVFGTSGHLTKPPGLVIENYVMRVDAPANRAIKSIVDPARTMHCVTGHHFHYDSLLATDENHYPIHGSSTRSVSFAQLRVNHYVTKSEDEARGKLGRAAFPKDNMQLWRSSNLEDRYEQHVDEAITIYAPALREALKDRPHVSTQSRASSDGRSTAGPSSSVHTRA